MILKDLIKILDTIFEKNLALQNDVTGLQTGKLESNVSSALIVLDITEDVIHEALTKKVDLIITHHPLIFEPIVHIISNTIQGKKILNLVEKGISVYTAHTNFDSMPDGLNYGVAERIGLKNIRTMDQITGLGRIGELLPPEKFSDFIKSIKNRLDLKNLKWISKSADDSFLRTIKTAAVINGSANSFTDSFSMYDCECDVVIVGEIKYHNSLEIIESGKILIELGHGESEKISIDLMYDKLNSIFKTNQDLKLIKSRPGYIPWRYYIE